MERKYSLIATNAWCQSPDGKLITKCYDVEIESIDGCEAYCTHQTSCAGYNYKKSDKECHLFLSSDDACPNGFAKVIGILVKTMEGSKLLKASWTNGWDCYGKIPGICILYFEQ